MNAAAGRRECWNFGFWILDFRFSRARLPEWGSWIEPLRVRVEHVDDTRDFAPVEAQAGMAVGDREGAGRRHAFASAEGGSSFAG